MTRLLRLWRWTLALSATLGLAGACDNGALVGGECRPELSQCGKACMDLARDTQNCGACGMSCSDGQFCNSGVCRLIDGGVTGGGGSTGSGGASGGASAGGAAGNPGMGGISGAGGLATAGSAGGEATGGADATGGGGNLGGTGGTLTTGGSSGAGGLVSAAGSGGGPNPVTCDAPASACGQWCVDTMADPGHCGVCFNECASGLCQAGLCVGTASGHIVLMCTNLRQASLTSTPAVLLGNAVFLPLNNLGPMSPVRVLAYSEYADSASVNSVNAILVSAASKRGRTLSLTSATDSTQALALLNAASFEVLLVHDQPAAPAGTLAQIGSAWATAIDTYVDSGGTVIMLSSGASTRGDGDMDDFATNAGILSIVSEAPASLQTFYNRAPTDAVGTGVVSQFLSIPDSCTFNVSSAADAKTVFVVTDAAPVDGVGNPAVIHRIP